MGRLTLLTVNGHPDDESVTVGGTMARYAAEGVRVVCVIGTRGEVGEIVDPALATPANFADLGAIREDEARRALSHLGSIDLRFLGYRDSGMPGTPENADPRSFTQADLDEATGRLVRIVREVRPQVIVGPNEFGGDGHPDHIRAGELARAAFARAGDPTAYPEQLADGLEPWQPNKLYEPVTDLGRRRKLIRALRSDGIGAAALILFRAARHWRPGRERERSRSASAQHAVTTRVNVSRFIEAKYAALAEHRTQVAPDSDHFVLTPQQRKRVVPTEDFALRAVRGLQPPTHEKDLFAGLRSNVEA